MGVQQLMDSVLRPSSFDKRSGAGQSPVQGAIDKALADPSTPEHHTGLARALDIPGDIAGVFKQGVGELQAAPGRIAQETARNVAASTLSPGSREEMTRAGMSPAAQEHVRKLLAKPPDEGIMSLLGSFFDIIGSPVKGPVRSTMARPIAERLDLDGSLEEKVRKVESVTDMALPVVGLVPYAKLPRLFARPPDPLKGFTSEVADDLFKLRQTGTADRAELRSALEAQPAPERTQEVQEIIYNLIERKNVASLPADQQAFLRDPQNLAATVAAVRSLAPFRLELSNLYNRLRRLGIPDTDLVDPEYVHRRAVGHDYTLDLAASGQSADPVLGVQRTLPRTTSALQSRKMMGGEAADGSRIVISETPAGTLQAHTGGATSTPVTPHPTIPDAFTHGGKTYQIGQATSLEIETATARETHPVTYYKNALANTVDALARMRAVARHVEWLDNIKKSPEFKVYGTQRASIARQLGWKESSLPQLDGWFLHPRLRAAFDDFYHPGIGPNEAVAAFRKVNQFATASLFWNPTPHIENVLGHWVVGRGFDWIKPQGVRSLFQDGARAIRAVTTQNEDYRRLLKAGSGMIFGGVKNADFYRDVAKLAGMDIKRNPWRWDPIARTIGVGPSDLARAWYEGSKRTLWWANDIFMMQRVLELERKGMTTARAIKEAEKHIPNYRIPTEVFGQRWFSQVLQEPMMTVFSRYHYGVFNSYASMVRDLVAGKTGQERVDAIGNMMALGLLTWVAYPVVEAGIQHLTGDEDAKKIPRGPAAFPSAIQELYEGDRTWEQVVSSAMTIPSATKLAATIAAGGHDIFTGQPITEPESPAGEQVVQAAGYVAGQMLAPWKLLNKRPEDEGGNSPVREILNQVAGLKDTSDAAQKSSRIRKKIETKRAKKREQHPRGIIERLYGGTD
jgi:hypothetical protein